MRVAFRWRASVLSAVVVATALGCGRSSLNVLQDYEMDGASGGLGGGGAPTSFGGGKPVPGGMGGTFGSLAGMAGVAGTFVPVLGGGGGAGAGAGGAGVAGADLGACSLSLTDCYTEDEPECRGTVPKCVGQVLDHHLIWSTRGVWVLDMAIAPDRRIAIAGFYQGLLNLDQETLPGVAKGDDGFVLVFDSDGKFLMFRGVGGDGAQALTGVAFAPGGDIVVQASWDPAPDAAAERPNGSGFVMRMDQTGTEQWGSSLNAAPLHPGGIGIDNNGAITAVGGFKDKIQYQDLVQEMPGYAGYVLHIDKDGSPMWLGATVPDGWKGAEAQRVVVDDEDNVHVLGSGATADNAQVSYLQKRLGPGGVPVYLKQLGASENLEAGALAVDRKMNPVVVGNFRGELALGGLSAKTGVKFVDDLWAAQLSRQGEWSWLATSDGAMDDTSKQPAVTTDPAGNVISVETRFHELRVHKRRSSGTALWTQSFATLAPTTAALASQNNGNVWLAASFAKTFQLGDESINPQGDESVLLVKLGR